MRPFTKVEMDGHPSALT